MPNNGGVNNLGVNGGGSSLLGSATSDAINTDIINTFTINGPTPFGTGSGQLIAIEQNTAIIGSGQLIAIEQIVGLLEIGSGLLLSIEQNTRSIGVGNICTIEQRVITPLVNNTFFNRNGYDINIIIDGYEIPRDEITGEVTILKEVNKSASARFTWLPPLGTQTQHESWQGKPVYINIITDDGTFRSFTGYVDLPTLDIIDKKITFDCTDRRNSRILDLSSSTINNVGKYSEIVFGEAKDKLEELDKRLSTVASDFDFDNFGVGRLTPWRPKTTADYTLSGSDIYYDRPEVSYTNRTSTINRIDITLNYTYQRLHQQVVNVTWSGFQNFCSWYVGSQQNGSRAEFPLRETILAAAKNAQWQPIGDINFTDIWPAQGFSCSGGSVIWQPNDVQHEYKARTRRANVLQPDLSIIPVETFLLDRKGNKIYDIAKTTITDKSSMLCRSANWKSGIKFAQNIKETYTITMKSPQAITKYGSIRQEDKYDFVDEFDVSVWENKETGIYDSTVNFYVNEKPKYSEFVSAMHVALLKAKTQLQSVHRDVAVNFRKFIWPQIDLHHTVRTTATQVSCKGKVNNIRHVIDVGTGAASTEVGLKLSRAAATDSESTFAVQMPPIEDSSYIGVPSTITLGTHTGKDPDTLAESITADWDGWIANAYSYRQFEHQFIQRSNFTNRFIINYPEIPDTLRKEKINTSTFTGNIEIRNDDLTVVF